jgi:hypothetical protein
MLTALQIQRQRRRRPVPSLRQRWQEYILRRVEGYKNSLSREELLRIGDEAVAELEATVEGQFVLTELLMQDTVDRLIWRRLALKPFRQWAAHYRAIRAAQREPTHWGIDPRSPVSQLLPRLEPNDTALVLGPGAEAYTYLLAAHDMLVTFIGGDLACVERVEARMVEESLSDEFCAYVVQLGRWMPELGGQVHLVVLDAGSLQRLSARDRESLLLLLQEMTVDGGAHLVVPGLHSSAPEVFLGPYSHWSREPHRPTRRRGTAASPGILLTKPLACRSDTDQCVSKGHARAGSK